MLLTIKENVSNVSSVMFWIATTSVKSFPIIVSSLMKTVFVQNVKTATILMKSNNVNLFLKTVYKLIKWVSVLSVDLDSNLMLVSVQLDRQVDQIWIVLNRMKKVNARNVGTFIH